MLIAFSKRKNILGWLIRTVTRGIVDHAFFIYKNENGILETYGAELNGLVKTPLSVFKKKRTVVAAFSPIGFSVEDGLRKTLNQEGITDHTKYDISGLFGMAFVIIERNLKMKHPENFFDNKHEVFCSEICAEVILQCIKGTPLESQWPLSNLNPNTIDPQLLLDSIEKCGFFKKEVIP